MSKADAANFLRVLGGIASDKTMSVGNDYNDEALLKWSKRAFVVENSPAYLKNLYENTQSNNEDGFAKAVKLWMKSALKS